MFDNSKLAAFVARTQSAEALSIRAFVHCLNFERRFVAVLAFLPVFTPVCDQGNSDRQKGKYQRTAFHTSWTLYYRKGIPAFSATECGRFSEYASHSDMATPFSSCFLRVSFQVAEKREASDCPVEKRNTKHDVMSDLVR